MDIFESASRKKLRFASPKGELTAEQLWDLPLLTAGSVRTSQGIPNVDLDTIARTVSKSLKDVSEESFVTVSTNPAKAIFELQLEIVKHIIAVKVADAAKAKDRADKADKRRKLLDALAAKEDEEIGAKSKDTILKELAELDAE
jgi:hypothetical protein